jgi:hypothetical protein
VRSTAAPYTESRLTRSVANERVGFPVVEQLKIRIKNKYLNILFYFILIKNKYFILIKHNK